MTQDDIIRMAREAGSLHEGELFVPDAFVLRFANLVAAAEREACAKVCEDWAKSGAEYSLLDAIRARGEK